MGDATAESETFMLSGDWREQLNKARTPVAYNQNKCFSVEEQLSAEEEERQTALASTAQNRENWQKPENDSESEPVDDVRNVPNVPEHTDLVVNDFSARTAPDIE